VCVWVCVRERWPSEWLAEPCAHAYLVGSSSLLPCGILVMNLWVSFARLVIGFVLSIFLGSYPFLFMVLAAKVFVWFHFSVKDSDTFHTHIETCVPHATKLCSPTVEFFTRFGISRHSHTKRSFAARASEWWCECVCVSLCICVCSCFFRFTFLCANSAATRAAYSLALSMLPASA